MQILFVRNAWPMALHDKESKQCVETCDDVRTKSLSMIKIDVIVTFSLKFRLGLIMLLHCIGHNTTLDLTSCGFGHIIRKIDLSRVRLI
jgi:hypothetical protein